MADPQVVLTNGVPTSGSGIITTLGQLLPIAKTAMPTGVADGATVSALFDKLGKQVITGSSRELRDSFTVTVTSTTGAQTLVPGVSSQYTDIYGLVLTNINATTATEVIVSDGTKSYSFMVPPGETRGFMLPDSGALKATTMGTQWTIQTVTSVASLKASAFYTKCI